MSRDKTTRESLANQISKEFGIAYSIAYKKIDNILNHWCHKLISTDLSISSIGSFKIKSKKSRIGRNPKTKEEYEIKPRKVISYKKSNKLKI